MTLDSHGVNMLQVAAAAAPTLCTPSILYSQGTQLAWPLLANESTLTGLPVANSLCDHFWLGREVFILQNCLCRIHLQLSDIHWQLSS